LPSNPIQNQLLPVESTKSSLLTSFLYEFSSFKFHPVVRLLPKMQATISGGKGKRALEDGDYNLVFGGNG
jgi:hypothetical protein